MIHLDRLSRSSPPPAPELIFDDVTVTLPGNGICAVFGAPKSGRTTLLQLLSRTKKPERGAVLSTSRFSPIANAGSFFHPKLSTLENITLAARCFGMNATALTHVAISLPGFDGDLDTAAGKLNAKTRRSMETLVSALLPFDVYLLDDIERTPSEVLPVLLQILSTRKSGMIFTTRTPNLVEQYANCVTIIRDKRLFSFETVHGVLNQDDE